MFTDNRQLLIENDEHFVTFFDMHVTKSMLFGKIMIDHVCISKNLLHMDDKLIVKTSDDLFPIIIDCFLYDEEKNCARMRFKAKPELAASVMRIPHGIVYDTRLKDIEFYGSTMLPPKNKIIIIKI